MEMGKMLYEGKAKQVFATEKADEYLVHYKDDATAFNGEKKGTIADKGILNNKMSAFFFELLEKEGVPTHFVKLVNDRDMLVKALQIIPLEVITRNIAAGSLAKRLGLEEGTELEAPVVEMCYKNDELGDPMVNDYHIAALKIATPEQVKEIEAMALKVNDVLKKFLLEKNVLLVDFKLEFGWHNGKILLGDEISPDTCRYWDSVTKEKLDKDRFRRDLGNVEEAYHEMLRRVTGQDVAK